MKVFFILTGFSVAMLNALMTRHRRNSKSPIIQMFICLHVSETEHVRKICLMLGF